MAGTNFLAGQASLWVQPDGPNSEPKYLGCHSIGDIPEPKGDSTLLYCPDPARTGKFVVKNSFKGEPGTITTSIETDIRKTADYLEDMVVTGCPFPLFVHKVSTGRRDVFTNFDRSYVLRGVEITQSTLTNLAARSSADEGESTQSFDVSVQEAIRAFKMACTRMATTETEDINGIAILGEDRCEGGGNRAMKADDLMFLTSSALVGSAANTADVLISSYSSPWAATAADPFAGGEKILGIVGFLISATVVRVMVARGSTAGGAPAEIAYSDNNGVSWTTVNVGAVNGEYCASAHSLFALDRYNIWLGTSGGRIYFSNDGGLTWTLQENASISATAIMGISFVDELNGYAVYTGGTGAVSRDGETWSSVGATGTSAATDIHTISQFFAWVSGTDGLYYTMDGGDTWAKRSSDNIAAVDFANELFGMAAGGANNGLIWFTIDGGFDWLPLDAITNAGFTDVKVVSSKLAYVTGKISAGTGFIGKILPV